MMHRETYRKSEGSVGIEIQTPPERRADTPRPTRATKPEGPGTALERDVGRHLHVFRVDAALRADGERCTDLIDRVGGDVGPEHMIPVNQVRDRKVRALLGAPLLF